MDPFVISHDLRSYLDQIKGFEKNIPYMYLDSEGQVTVGMGHNLTSHGDCQRLSFVVKRFTRKAVLGGAQGIPIGLPQMTGRAAMPAEKKNDYDFLKGHPGLGNFAPEQLAAYTTVEMAPLDINRLFEDDLKDAIGLARNAFHSAFDDFPVSCQAALIDIAFNCGSFDTFHTIAIAAKGQGPYAEKSWSERWKAAAVNCQRGAVNANRNAKISQWFMDGSNGAG